jgi:cell division protein FtsL
MTIESSLIILFYTILIIIFSIIKYNDGYKQGQIDALNNKIKYELRENEDGTKEWVEIKRRKGGEK